MSHLSDMDRLARARTHTLSRTHTHTLTSSRCEQILREDAAAAPGNRPAAHRGSGPAVCVHHRQRESNMCPRKNAPLPHPPGEKRCFSYDCVCVCVCV